MIVDRNLHNRWICIATALALLAAVMTSPLRPLNSNDALSRPNRLRRDFAIPPTRSATHFLKSITLRAAPVKTVCLEDDEEEKLSRAECPAWCSLGLPRSSLLKMLTWAPAAFGLTRTSQPLRC